MKPGMLISLLVFSHVTASCALLGESDDTEPLDAEAMYVQYKKSGGWINTTQLVINQSGTVESATRAHGSGEVIARSTIVLGKDTRETLADLFSGFRDLRKRYEPDVYYTDGNTREVVLRYQERIDTVSVYGDPAIPRRLKNILMELEHILQSTGI